MSNCSVCGNVMNYYHEYDRWYCHSCQSYREPAPAYAPAPPPPPPPPPQQQQSYAQPRYGQASAPDKGGRGRSGKLMIAAVVLAVIIIIASAVYMFAFYGSPSDKDEDAVEMDMNELRSDYVGTEFLTLSPGDKVVVEDEIVYIATDWDDEYDTDVTYIWLKSAHGDENIYDWYDPMNGDYYDHDFTFEGDLTDEYYVGADVKITLHVTEVSALGMEMEVFKEMWDDGELVPLPVLCMRLVTPWPDDDTEAVFPTIEVNLRDTSGYSGLKDRMTVKHVQGDPVDWSDYKMIITNNSDESSTVLTQLWSLGSQNAGESVQINSTIIGFNLINYEKGKSYTLEIYNLKENKRVYNRDNLICS